MGFLKEFKEFALKGNVMDMAVGVLIGSAFGGIVTSFTTSFINPIISIIGGAEVAGKIQIGTQMVTSEVDGVKTSTLEPIFLDWGAFVTAVINFIIMAFCIFCMVKAVNKIMSIGKKPAAPAEPTTKTCPFCQSEISIKAVKCPHCTSDQPEEEAAAE